MIRRAVVKMRMMEVVLCWNLLCEITTDCTLKTVMRRYTTKEVTYLTYSVLSVRMEEVKLIFFIDAEQHSDDTRGESRAAEVIPLDNLQSFSEGLD